MWTFIQASSSGSQKLGCVATLLRASCIFCLSYVTLTGRGYSSWAASQEKRIQKEELGFVVVFGFVLLILSLLKGWGKGGTARHGKHETIVFTSTCPFVWISLCLSISVWEISEDTVWKCRNENIVSRCQNFLFSIFYSTWFWMECLYMFKRHCRLQNTHPSAWKFSYFFSYQLIFCPVLCLSLLFQDPPYYSWNRNYICSPKNAALHPQNLLYLAICH